MDGKVCAILALSGWSLIACNELASVGNALGLTQEEEAKFTRSQLLLAMAALLGSSSTGSGGCTTHFQMGGQRQGCALSLGYNVTTLAGGPQGTTTCADTDGTGTSARFNQGQQVATDGTNLYVAEATNNKIRKVVIATGVVTTLAGPGAGSTASGDADGLGNAARFNSPFGITTDGTNLYVADTGNNKIRKVVISSGAVTTLAGPAAGSTTGGDADGTGNAASFTGPLAITTDGTNLYVGGDNKIRKIVIATGVVTTLAGPAPGASTSGDTDATGNAARFASILGIGTDGTNLYVGQGGTAPKVRKVVIATAVVTTLAGPGQGGSGNGTTDGTGTAARFGSVYNITTDGTDLYVTDGGNHKIRRIGIASGTVTTVAGPPVGSTDSGDTDAQGTSARFFSPRGITTDGSALFVMDFNYCKLRQIQ